MMGLLDWLQDAIGGAGNAASDPMTMGGVSSAGTPAMAPPMPPAAPPGGGIGSDAARAPSQPPMPPGPQPTQPMPPIQPTDNTGGQAPVSAGTDFSTPGWSTKSPTVPPTPPGGSGVTAPSQSAVPPVPIVPPGGPAIPPGAAPTEGITPPSSGPGLQARGILGRALGMDPNTERRLSGGLAAGLKAAGNSSGKSPFQALASGAGATLEGGDQADDKTTGNQQKYLDQAIKAAQMGDTRALNQARTQLALAQTKMTLEGKGGKDSVVNSDQQLYLRAQGATNQDANLKILKSQYDKIATERGSSSPEAKAAMDAYQKTYDDTLNGHLGRLGLDPKKAEKLGKQPGMTQDNPVPKTKMTSQEDFDKLAPGMFFINPKDGKVLMKPMPGVGGAAGAMGPNGAPPAAGAPPAPGGQTLPAGQGGVPAPTGQSLPPMPPKAPTNPVASSIPGMGADEDVDEKEPA